MSFIVGGSQTLSSMLSCVVPPELDILGEFPVGRGSDQSQQWVENPGHLGSLRFFNLEACFTFLVEG